VSDRSLPDIARDAVGLARKKGAAEASAVVGRNRDVEVDWRDGRIEKISDATTREVTLELYVGGRYSVASTSDLRPDALARFVEDAVTMTRALAKDPYRSLPDPALYRGQADVELALDDPRYDRVDATQRRHLAQAAEAAAGAVPGAAAIQSVTGSFSDGWSESFRAHSNGFEGAQRQTQFWLSCSVSVRDDDNRPEDSDYAGARFLAELPSPEAIGRGAIERALSRRGAKKGKSAKMVMMVDRRVGGRFVGFLAQALSGASLQQKRSFLEGKLGQTIASAKLTLTDDPLRAKGFGSRRFDDEGIAARRLPIVEAGALRSYFIDTYYAKKLGVAPTTGRWSNLTFQPGDRSRAELIADLADGILVTSFLGGNSNTTTGDFSVGVRGFAIRNGKLAEPVAEMNVSGNQLELWRNLVAVGNDPNPYSSLLTPTLVFEGVQLAGV
jgi:PmbA protein